MAHLRGLWAHPSPNYFAASSSSLLLNISFSFLSLSFSPPPPSDGLRGFLSPLCRFLLRIAMGLPSAPAATTVTVARMEEHEATAKLCLAAAYFLSLPCAKS